MLAKKGSAATTGAAIFTVVILAVIVDALIGATTYSSALAQTVKGYVVPAFLLCAVVIAIVIGRSS